MKRCYKTSIIHAIFNCRTCGMTWQDYKTARKNAYVHAKRNKHHVSGEEAYAVIYNFKIPCFTEIKSNCGRGKNERGKTVYKVPRQ